MALDFFPIEPSQERRALHARLTDAWQHAMAAIGRLYELLLERGYESTGVGSNHGDISGVYPNAVRAGYGISRSDFCLVSVNVPVTLNDGSLVPMGTLAAFLVELVVLGQGATLAPRLGFCLSKVAEIDFHIGVELWDSNIEELELLIADWRERLGQREISIVRVNAERAAIIASSNEVDHGPNGARAQRSLE